MEHRTFWILFWLIASVFLLILVEILLIDNSSHRTHVEEMSKEGYEQVQIFKEVPTGVYEWRKND